MRISIDAVFGHSIAVSTSFRIVLDQEPPLISAGRKFPDFIGAGQPPASSFCSSKTCTAVDAAFPAASGQPGSRPRAPAAGLPTRRCTVHGGGADCGVWHRERGARNGLQHFRWVGGACPVLVMRVSHSKNFDLHAQKCSKNAFSMHA